MGSKAKPIAPNPQEDYNQYLNEANAALDVQGQILPRMISMQDRFAPQLSQSQLQNYGIMSTGMLGLADRLYQPSLDFQTKYAGGQMGLMAGMAPGATQAVIGGMDDTTRSIYQTYGQQALSDLQTGTGLSAQEQAFATQSARRAAQARGMNFSRQGADLEILNTYQLGQQRLAQRQATAAQAYQFGQGVQSLGMQGFLSPSLQAAQPYSATGLIGMAQQAYPNLGESFLQPESQYLANIRSNRIQMLTAVQGANAARSGALGGAAIGAVGTIAGAALI